MKIRYHAETDSLYVEFKAGPGAETRQVSDGLNVDLDAAGQIVGFDIDLESSGPLHPRGRSASHSLV